MFVLFDPSLCSLRRGVKTLFLFERGDIKILPHCQGAGEFICSPFPPLFSFFCGIIEQLFDFRPGGRIFHPGEGIESGLAEGAFGVDIGTGL